MKGPEIIALSGKSGSGKDFVGRELLRPAGFHQWALAWPLKQMAVAMGLGKYDEVHHTKPPEVRHALQQLGTEEGWQKRGRFYWCTTAEAWMKTMAEQWGVSRFYLTDVRFQHEAAWVRSMGGQLVRLELGDRPYPLAGTPAAAHSSETDLDAWTDWDAVIVNRQGTTLDQIRRELQAVDVLQPTHDRSQLTLSLG